MSAFAEELTRYVRSGQTAFYVNSREESRVVTAVREAGWRLRHMDPSLDERVVPYKHSELKAALKLGGVDKSVINKIEDSSAPPADLLIDALRAVEKMTVELVDDTSKSDAEFETAMLAAGDAERVLTASLNHFGWVTICWDSVSGFEAKAAGFPEMNGVSQENPRAALAAISDPTKKPRRCLFIMKDCHAHLSSENQPIYRRALRTCCEDDHLVRGHLSKHLIFLQPYMRPHDDIRHCLVRLDLPLPGDKEISEAISAMQQSVDDPEKCACSDDLRGELISAMRGMDTGMLERTLAYCLVTFGGFTPEITEQDGTKRKLVAAVRGMRSRQLSTGNGLRILDPDDPELQMLGTLGGYENVFNLAERVKFCRSAKARELGIVAPNGMGLAGPPGCGKTICAKLFAKWLGVPLCLVNLGTLKEGLVGASESNTAAAIATIRALGECVVLLDEWDKQAGNVVSGANDGNTSLGMLSLLLDFASDPTRKAFLVFTMNRLSGPIESLRAGRISRFFYTPLPNPIEREEIVNIKLSEAGAPLPSERDRKTIANQTEGLSGAELTEMVNEALALAAEELGTKETTLAHFTAARAVVTPVTKLNKEEIDAMSNFEGIALSVNAKKAEAATAQDVAKRRNIRLDRGESMN